MPHDSSGLLIIGDCDPQGAHPHRWKHTFAVMALVNSMDAFTLQSSLGHSSMEMVRRYLNVAQPDISRIQQKASPVANLGLRGCCPSSRP